MREREANDHTSFGKNLHRRTLNGKLPRTLVMAMAKARLRVA